MLEESAGKSRKGKPPIWKRKWVWVVASLFILSAIGRALPQANDSSAGSDSSETGNSIGSQVKSGKLAFTVNGITCGIASEGLDDANGQFCELDMTVENTGKKELVMYADDDKLYDTQGREYKAATGTMLGIDSPLGLAQTIGAGETVNGVILYDIPAGDSPDHVKVYNSDGVFALSHKISLK